MPAKTAPGSWTLYVVIVQDGHEVLAIGLLASPDVDEPVVRVRGHVDNDAVFTDFDNPMRDSTRAPSHNIARFELAHRFLALGTGQVLHFTSRYGCVGSDNDPTAE